ncbi:Phenylacrylic acid decarboxylase [Lophium mytilinum]|uniref:Flavin prenyltransferase PAD1, mitochondrial n=1 Tax=Lophium mytilinum TaxID=390894 RepID=A0A6A6QVN9_9PEZI|nr:Phenylacrylic acid decarboxylase [Lophium mytilinum]
MIVQKTLKILAQIPGWNRSLSLHRTVPLAHKQYLRHFSADGHRLTIESNEIQSDRPHDEKSTPPTMPRPRRKRIVVAVTGATGAPLATSLLLHLKKLDVEMHLILSTWGSATLKYELEAPNNTAAYLASLAHYSYSPRDVSASLSSGSFRTDGMIVVPCSMKTLAGIRMGYDNDLITRSAGVTLKERRRLVLVARETPLSSIHLENMLEVTRAGAVVFPPMMTFYTKPKAIQDMVEQSVRRMIDLLDLGFEDHIHADGDGRWNGFEWKKKMSDEKQA